MEIWFIKKTTDKWKGDGIKKSGQTPYFLKNRVTQHWLKFKIAIIKPFNLFMNLDGQFKESYV